MDRVLDNLHRRFKAGKFKYTIELEFAGKRVALDRNGERVFSKSLKLRSDDSHAFNKILKSLAIADRFRLTKHYVVKIRKVK